MSSSKKLEINFSLQNKNIYVSEDTTIALACSKAGFPLNLVCGAKGICKKCNVLIKKDNKKEKVLACKTKVSHGLEIFLSDEDIQSNLHILTQNNINPLEKISPSIHKYFISMDEFTVKHCFGYWESIEDYLGLSLKTPELSFLQQLPYILNDKALKGFTLVFWEDELISIEKNNTTQDIYGLAIDLGTTTIAAYLYHLKTGEKMGVYSTLNKQVTFGADVISRIVSSLKPNDLKEIQQKVIESINDLILQIQKENKIALNHIYTLCIAGNAPMQHLFLGIYPKHLGMSPFTCATLKDVVVSACKLNLNIHPNGKIHFLPLIGGFVGADTTAVLLSLKKDHKTKLVIDLGTNGEIMLCNNEKILVSSTAAGPALEGAGIQFGMRGTDGAIEGVSFLNQDVLFKVIGNKKIQGICGSGIVDLVAQMLKAGLINSRGKLLTKEEYLKAGGSQNFAKRLERINNIPVFILSYEDTSSTGEKIYLSQKDIRGLQLAKSAIYTACILLIKEFGIKEDNIDEILLAGAFGNYIHVENAQYIGLIPSFGNVPVKSIGNAAGGGVQLFMLFKKIRNNINSLLEKVHHVELATHPDFQEQYIRNTYFKENIYNK